MKDNSFKVQFNSSNQTFKPKFSQKGMKIKPEVEPKAKSIEDIYYDEVVFYDGGEVEGYGDN